MFSLLLLLFACSRRLCCFAVACLVPLLRLRLLLAGAGAFAAAAVAVCCAGLLRAFACVLAFCLACRRGCCCFCCLPACVAACVLCFRGCLFCWLLLLPVACCCLLVCFRDSLSVHSLFAPRRVQCWTTAARRCGQSRIRRLGPSECNPWSGRNSAALQDSMLPHPRSAVKRSTLPYPPTPVPLSGAPSPLPHGESALTAASHPPRTTRQQLSRVGRSQILRPPPPLFPTGLPDTSKVD